MAGRNEVTTRVSENNPVHVFDEQRAVAELERLLQSIEDARRQRQQASDAFEAFVRKFRTPLPNDVHPAPAAAKTIDVRQPGYVIRPVDVRRVEAARTQPIDPVQPKPSIPVAPVPEVAYVPPLAESEPPIPAPIAIEHADDSSDAIVPAALQSLPRTDALFWNAPRLLVLSAAAVVVVVVVLALARAWRAAPSETSPAEPEATATAEPAPAASAPVAAPEPPPPQSRLEAELIASRRVWVRVIADGERTVERELPAGARVPLRAERSFVIRAGDAGAVRLKMKDREQVLGPDGQVITRTISAAAGSGR